MPNSTLTRNYVREYVRTVLGAPVVEVELLDQHVQAAIDAALRVYNQTLPQRAHAALVVTPGQKKYPISHTNLRGVLSVDFVERGMLPEAGMRDPFLYSRMYSSLTGHATFGAIHQQAHYIDDARKLIGADPSWHGQWEGATYYLYIYVGREYDCSYEYTWGISPIFIPDDGTTPDPFGLAAIPDGHVQWFLDYTGTHCRAMLGRILRKHGIPSSEGGSENTDGETLVTEAREDLQKLEEALKRKRRPLMPVVG